MFRFLLPFLITYSTIAACSSVIDGIYNKVGSNLLDEIFVNRAAVKDILVEIDKEYGINLSGSRSFKELNDAMQKELIRKRGTERTDLAMRHPNIFSCTRLFRTTKTPAEYIANDMVPVVLGATFEAMRISLESVINAKESRVIMLVSDRPFIPEDFGADVAENTHKFLSIKNRAYAGKKSDIKRIVDAYLISRAENPAIGKLGFYAKIVGLVDKDMGLHAELLTASLIKAKNLHGTASKEFVGAMIKCREFLYTKQIKMLPTEHDLAQYLAEVLGFKRLVFINTKTKFKTQDRATTVDTYYDFLDHVKREKIDLSRLFIVNIGYYPYRQWLELVLLLSDSSVTKWPKFATANAKCPSSAVFVDELARLFFVIGKFYGSK